MSIISISADWFLRCIVSLTHSFVAIISDSEELRAVGCCPRAFREIGPPYWLMMWPYIEINL